MFPSDSDPIQVQARHLFHDLVNDLAAIQVRTDVLLRMAGTSTELSPALVKSDLATIRATTAHAITTAEQFELIVVDGSPPMTDRQEG